MCMLCWGVSQLLWVTLADTYLHFLMGNPVTNSLIQYMHVFGLWEEAEPTVAQGKHANSTQSMVSWRGNRTHDILAGLCRDIQPRSIEFALRR